MSSKQDNTSATLRAIAALEIIVRADQPVSLTEVMTEVALPRPTVHRILTLLEHSGLLQRARRAKLLDNLALQRYTENTITDRAKLELELERIRRDKISADNEEYITGLVCVAVPVLSRDGKSCASVAVQAPVARMPMDRALAHVPALRRAADALTKTYQEDAAARPRGSKRAPPKHRA